MEHEILKYYQDTLNRMIDVQKENAEDIKMLTQHLVDLLDPKCPPEYREVIKQDLERVKGTG